MPTPAQTDQLKTRVSNTFGIEPAETIWQDIIAKFGHIIGQLVINWLLSKVGGGGAANALPTSSTLLDPALLRGWLADFLTSHQSELETYLQEQIHTVVTDVILMIRGT